MALMSLSMKRHLEEDFPVAPPSPPQSPIFCSSPIRLLSSLHTSSLTENQPKKRRKQEHPLFLTDSQFAPEGASESSADEMENFHAQESKKETAANPSNHMDLDKVEDNKELHSSDPRDQLDRKRSGLEHRGVDEKRGIEINAGLGFEEKLTNTGNLATSISNVPLMLLSQVASDVIGYLSSSSSPLKSQPEVPNFPKTESVAETHVPSDGELPSGDPVTDGVAEVCPDCKKVFKRKIYLQRHIAREHWSLAKIFKCEKCAYETKHQSNLLVHRRTHTGERPYHCGACGQRYTQGHLLKAHIRSRHGADMRFYNMDKRTDGMRCRRLLGAKLIGGGKEDRIRFLLQAAEAARHCANPPSPPRPMFGTMMSPSVNQYMNVLSCLPNGLRPMLWPSLSGGLLGTSGGFPSTPLQNGMPSHAALLSSLAAPLSLSSGKMSCNDLSSKASGSLLSSMLALPSNVASLQAIKSESFASDQSVSKTLSLSSDNTVQNSFAVPVELAMMPEDLTTTRRTAGVSSESVTSTEKTSCQNNKNKEIDLIMQSFGAYSPSNALSLGQSVGADLTSPTDLSSHDTSKNNDSVNGNDLRLLPDDCLRLFPTHSEKNHQKVRPTKASVQLPNHESVMMTWSNAKCNFKSDPLAESSQSRRQSVNVDNIYSSQNQACSAQWNPISKHLHQSGGGSFGNISGDSSSHESPAKFVVKESSTANSMNAGCSEVASDGHSKCPESSGASCKEACCPYLKKLKDLRRNVYRMLCVFTPYLGVADINDYEADSIDEFLHEVIYSKLDDTE